MASATGDPPAPEAGHRRTGAERFLLLSGEGWGGVRPGLLPLLPLLPRGRVLTSALVEWPSATLILIN